MRKTSLGRRRFLKSAAVTGAAMVGGAAAPGAAAPQSAPVPARSGPASAPALARETDPAGAVEVLTTERPGGDFMVDVMKTLDFEYVAANPGSSFRGLHESLVNYGGNRAPEFITCCHEESSVAMAHGYFKVEGKPMAVLAHGTVGLQHAAMAIYNAYCDRVPVYIIAGNCHRCRRAASRRRVDSQRAGRGGDGPRLHQVGRPAGFAPALCRVCRARVQDRDDAADDAGPARRRRRASGRSHFSRGRAAHSEAHARDAAAGRLGRRGRGGAAAGRRGKSGDCGGPGRAHAGRHGAPRGTGRSAAGARRGSGRPPEFSDAPPAQSDRSRPRACRRRRRDPRPRADGFLGHG